MQQQFMHTVLMCHLNSKAYGMKILDIYTLDFSAVRRILEMESRPENDVGKAKVTKYANRRLVIDASLNITRVKVLVRVFCLLKLRLPSSLCAHYEL
jgi:hypothetical protein